MHSQPNKVKNTGTRTVRHTNTEERKRYTEGKITTLSRKTCSLTYKLDMQASKTQSDVETRRERQNTQSEKYT